MRKTIKLSNNFHNTEINLRALVKNGKLYLSKEQLKKAQKALCGSYECSCSDFSGIRGPQNQYDVDPYYQGEELCEVVGYGKEQ